MPQCRTAFVTGFFQALVGDFRPKLSQLSCHRLVRMLFGVVWCPRHWPDLRCYSHLIDGKLDGDRLANPAEPVWFRQPGPIKGVP
jgi:hypothetical protein